MTWWMLCTDPLKLRLAVYKSNGCVPIVFGMHNQRAVEAECKRLNTIYHDVELFVKAYVRRDIPKTLADYIESPIGKPGWSLGIKVLSPLIVPPGSMYTDDDIILPQGDLAVRQSWGGARIAFATNAGMGGQVLRKSDASRELVYSIDQVMGTYLDTYLWWDRQCDVGSWCLPPLFDRDEYMNLLHKFYSGVTRVVSSKRDSNFFRETDQLWFTAYWHLKRLPFTVKPGVKTGYARYLQKPDKSFMLNQRAYTRQCRNALLIHYGTSSHKPAWMHFLNDILPGRTMIW